MAISFSTHVDKVVQEFANQLFVDQVTRKQHFLSMLEQKPISSANGPRWRAKVTSTAAAGAYAEGAAAPAEGQFVEEQAELDWGQYHETLVLGGLSRDVLNASRAEYIDNYIVEQLDDRMAAIADKVNTDMLNGTVSNGITGITTAIDDTGTYAGISRSTYSNWQSYVNDNSGTPRALTAALMNTVHNTLIDTVAGNYTHILTSSTQADAINALSSGAGVLATKNLNVEQGSTMMTNIVGFKKLSPLEPVCYFNGRPVIAIPGYTAGRVDFVDMNKLHYEVLKAVSAEPLAKINDDDRWYITFKLQMVLTEPRKGAASLQDLS